MPLIFWPHVAWVYERDLIPRCEWRWRWTTWQEVLALLCG